MDNKQIIESFYRAFAEGDGEKMVSFYHDNIEFQDPAFGLLKGENAKNIWRMLTRRGKDATKINYKNIIAHDHKGSTSWTAEYRFPDTGRKVINKINASFEFKEGKIYRHTDHFDLWRWSRQALGLPGYLIGYTKFFQKKLQQKTNKLLRDYTKSPQDI